MPVQYNQPAFLSMNSNGETTETQIGNTGDQSTGIGAPVLPDTDTMTSTGNNQHLTPSIDANRGLNPSEESATIEPVVHQAGISDYSGDGTDSRQAFGRGTDQEGPGVNGNENFMVNF